MVAKKEHEDVNLLNVKNDDFLFVILSCTSSFHTFNSQGFTKCKSVKSGTVLIRGMGQTLTGMWQHGSFALGNQNMPILDGHVAD